MRTIKMTGRDFALSTDGMGFEMLEGAAALAQIIQNRLKRWKSEWFAVPNGGIDYLTLNSQKQNVAEKFRFAMRKEIRADSRIISINVLNVSFDNSTREITAYFEASTTEGLISGSV